MKELRFYHDCFARWRLRNNTVDKAVDKENPKPPELQLFRFLHTPENPGCCQPLLVLPSASAATHSCSHRVLKSLPADHRGHSMNWHHCWSFPRSSGTSQAGSRGRRGTSVTEGLYWHSQASPMSVPGLA